MCHDGGVGKEGALDKLMEGMSQGYLGTDTWLPWKQAYERGISLFKWPNVSDIWSTYLTKFIARYGGRKLERARDLFEQALDGCPPKYAKSEESVGCRGTWG